MMSSAPAPRRASLPVVWGEAGNGAGGLVVLAPMVRVGTLPFRLLALRYGADLVYTEEIIAQRLVEARRVDNARLGSVDFVLPCGTVLFRTCPEERRKVVLQLGAAQPDVALRAALLVQHDVAVIDLNMGCPKAFSIKGGMGAMLLETPDTAVAILTTLVSRLSVPVTCKIRLLRNAEESVQLALRLAATGVACMAVHGRSRTERRSHPVRTEDIAAVAAALREVGCPVLANGGSIQWLREGGRRAEIECFRAACGADGVMIARAAAHNPAVLRRVDGDAPDACQLAREYLALAARWDLHVQGAKYCFSQLLEGSRGAALRESAAYQAAQSAPTLRELLLAWGMADEWQAVRGGDDDEDTADDAVAAKRLRVDAAGSEEAAAVEEGGGAVRGRVRYIRQHYPSAVSPKQRLLEYCRHAGSVGTDGVNGSGRQPRYEVREVANEKLFYAALQLPDGRRFDNLLGDKSKRRAEQAVAVLTLKELGLPDGSVLAETDTAIDAKVNGTELVDVAGVEAAVASADDEWQLPLSGVNKPVSSD